MKKVVVVLETELIPDTDLRKPLDGREAQGVVGPPPPDSGRQSGITSSSDRDSSSSRSGTSTAWNSSVSDIFQEKMKG
jgi:hypothetical protein